MEILSSLLRSCAVTLFKMGPLMTFCLLHFVTFRHEAGLHQKLTSLYLKPIKSTLEISRLSSIKFSILHYGCKQSKTRFRNSDRCDNPPTKTFFGLWCIHLFPDEPLHLWDRPLLSSGRSPIVSQMTKQ